MSFFVSRQGARARAAPSDARFAALADSAAVARPRAWAPQTSPCRASPTTPAGTRPPGPPIRRVSGEGGRWPRRPGEGPECRAGVATASKKRQTALFPSHPAGARPKRPPPPSRRRALHSSSRVSGLPGHIPEVDVGAWWVNWEGGGGGGVRGKSEKKKGSSSRRIERASPPPPRHARPLDSPDGFLMPGILDDFLPVLVFFTPAALGAMVAMWVGGERRWRWKELECAREGIQVRKRQLPGPFTRVARHRVRPLSSRPVNCTRAQSG